MAIMVSIFQRLKALWDKFAQITGAISNAIFLTLFYFIIAMPFGIIGRFFTDPLLLRKRREESKWSKCEILADRIDKLRSQF